MHPRIEVDRYLDRIDVDRPVAANRATLDGLQRAHLAAVPFENLDIVFAGGATHDRGAAIDKIQNGRGGWCFEVNGAFAALLDELGFDVRLIGAAVLLDGPSTLLDHLALEVTAPDDAQPGPFLVDAGFGQSFIRPLELNHAGAQDGGDAMYQLLPSPQGTTLAEIVDEVPEARYRFKRVAHDFDDFAPVAAALQADTDKHWRSKPFATRLLGDGDDRVTLTRDSLKLKRDGVVTEQPVDRTTWDRALDEWFAMERPGPWPDER